MAINATNYDGTKDYKISELDDVFNSNLLINGDFLCWQRGPSFTVNNTIQLACDMWKIWGLGDYGISHVTSDAGKGTGITWRNKVGNIIYIFPDEMFNFLNGKKITITYSKNKKVYPYGTVQVNNKKIIESDFGLAVGDVLNWVHANIGEVATPHVPEDYGKSIARSSAYIERGNYPISSVGDWWIGGFSFRFSKKSVPTVNINNIYDANGAVSGSPWTTGAVDTTGVMFITKNGGAAGVEKIPLYADATISCEPTN